MTTRQLKELYKLTAAATGILNWFTSITGYSYDKAIEYFNTNNIWEILDNKILLSCVNDMDVTDVIDLIGKGLSDSEKHTIISRYNQRLQDNR